MFYAKDELGNKVDIVDSIKGNKYFCSCCDSEVIQKKGRINQWHFAHKNLKECDSWYEMTEWHRSWQEKFPSQFREVVMTNEYEKHIADIKVGNLVVEFQHSPISIDTFEERWGFYTAENHLVWLFDLRDKDIECVRKLVKKTFLGTRATKSGGMEYLYDRKYRDYYKWNYAKRFLEESVKDFKDMDLFFQIHEDYIVKVEWNKQGLKYFGGKKYTKEEFMNYLRSKYVELEHRNKVA